MEAQTLDSDPLFVVATPPSLARHVAGLLDLPVLSAGSGPAADGRHRLLLVATAAAARSIVADGYVARLGRRLAAVVTWHVEPADLEVLLGHLQAAGVPAFVGVPERNVLENALRHGTHTAVDDLALAAYLATVEPILTGSSRA